MAKTTTRTRKKTKAKTVAEKSCLLIQWERKKPPVDKDGNPVCPDCGKPAEMILGIFGQPCWAHK